MSTWHSFNLSYSCEEFYCIANFAFKSTGIPVLMVRENLMFLCFSYSVPLVTENNTCERILTFSVWAFELSLLTLGQSTSELSGHISGSP